MCGVEDDRSAGGLLTPRDGPARDRSDGVGVRAVLQLVSPVGGRGGGTYGDRLEVPG